ncbi:MAG: MBL fold metallo-hydrolase [Treponema sp.]|jgi:L-ascorbate metabolism protein UlaG (beta-lactamase superfamily)|nr:MBL fold metallo-hydrolase [Treponema sp.]
MSGQNRWYKQGRALLDEIDRSRPGEGEAHIWFMGQHGFVLSLPGALIYIDVILNPLPGRDGRDLRSYPPPYGPGEVTSADYVFCTHPHSDHLNLKTLLPLAEACREARFVVPRPSRPTLTGAGIAENRVISAVQGEELSLGALKIIPVAAIHTCFIQDESEKDENGCCTSLGFVIKGGGLSIYHPGDTWITPGLAADLKKLGPLDIAFLPINGTDWERTADNCIGNMNALDAVKLAMAVPIDLVIPSHYDMMPGNSENPALFAGYMYRHCPQKRFHICALGEGFIYRKSTPRLKCGSNLA